MKKSRGKKPKYIVFSDNGLLKEECLKTLKDYTTSLLCSIRKELSNKIRGLNEKFNYRSRYFGYWRGDDKDRLYIYVQKKYLRIDLCIDREKYEKDVIQDGFKVHFINNFQGRNNWLTGWLVPHDTAKLDVVIKWIFQAFDKK